jgi:beta-galactosidase
MRLQIVHMAEFAWHAMEPREREFRFDWLERCLDLAKQRKMDVILCTPTAAPPVWLVDKHPEILPVDDCGRVARPGGRRH